jgi:hypothetical protein
LAGSESFGLAGVDEAFSAVLTRGAIIALFTSVVPQTEQLTMLEASNLSKAVPDWNQLSKWWSLAHFSVNWIIQMPAKGALLLC